MFTKAESLIPNQNERESYLKKSIIMSCQDFVRKVPESRKKDYFHSVLHLLNTPHFIKSDHLTKNIPGSRFKYVYRS